MHAHTSHASAHCSPALIFNTGASTCMHMLQNGSHPLVSIYVLNGIAWLKLLPAHSRFLREPTQELCTRGTEACSNSNTGGSCRSTGGSNSAARQVRLNFPLLQPPWVVAHWPQQGVATHVQVWPRPLRMPHQRCEGRWKAVSARVEKENAWIVHVYSRCYTCTCESVVTRAGDGWYREGSATVSTSIWFAFK